METTLLFINLGLTVAVLVLVFVFRFRGDNGVPQMLTKIIEVQNGLLQIERNLKEDFRINREESSGIAKENREELNRVIAAFRNETTEAIRNLSSQNVEVLAKSFKDFQEAFDRNVKSFNDLQREKFGQLEARQNELVQSTEKN